jgi:mannosyltransferase
MLVAAAFIFLTIGRKSFWLDEAFSVAVAQMPWPRFLHFALHEESNMALYYVLLRGWVRLFGESETAVRSLSAIFGLLCIPAIYGLAFRVYDRRVASISAVLLSVNTFYIQYAQESRSYSLLLLLSIASSYFFIRGIREPSLRIWSAYTIASAAAFYSHIYSSLLIFTHILSLFLLGRAHSVRLPAVASLGVTGILVLPLGLLLSGQTALDWLHLPSAHDLLKAAKRATGDGGKDLLTLYVGLCIWGGVATLRNFDRQWRSSLFLSIWLILPVGISLAFSYAVKPVFHVRYLIISLPALVILAAVGLVHARPTILRLALVLLLTTTISSKSLPRWYSETGSDWRGAVDYVLSEAQLGDKIAFDPPYNHIAFDYYLRRKRAQEKAPEPISPAVDPIKSERPETLLDLFRRDVATARIWVISSDDKAWLGVETQSHLVHTHSVEGLEISLFGP